MATPTLLVVGFDDDSVPDALAATGSTLTRVPSAEAALDRIAGDPPDCVVAAQDVDGETGGDTGLSLLTALRERGSNVPFVLVGDLDASAVDRTFDAGAEYVSASNRAVGRVVARRVSRLLGVAAVDDRTHGSGGSATGTDRAVGVGHADWSPSATVYERIFETVGDGVYALDGDGRFVAVNEAYCELTGYDREELLGEPGRKVTGSTIGAEAEELQRRLEAGKSVVTLETELPTADGDAVPVEARVTLYPLSDGGDGRIGVVRDVSERRRIERQLRRERDLNERIIETSLIGIALLDAEGCIEYANAQAAEILGVDAAELARAGDPGSGFEFVDASGELVDPDSLPFGDVIETGEPLHEYELGVRRPNGELVWLAINGAPLYENGVATRAVFTFLDVTERRRRAERLSELNGTMRSLLASETTREVCDLAASAAGEVLTLPNPVVALYDDETGELESASQTDVEERLDPALLGSHGEDLAWEVFVAGESRAVPDLAAAVGADPADLEMASALVVPLGRHGVFISAAPEPRSYSETDVSLAEILAGNVRAALDRTERERSLRDQRDRLREQNETLERLHRINGVIRDITTTLTHAETRTEIEEAVCTKLANADPYRFAWIGRVDPVDGSIDPVASGGGDHGYLDAAVRSDAEGTAGQGPAREAARTRDPQVQNHILADPPFEPWREAALRRGFRASIAVPLVHQDTVFGVLNVYAGEAGVFDATEQNVLTELGGTIAYTVNALERRQALVSRRSVELEYAVGDAPSSVLGFGESLTGTFEVRNVVYRSDGQLHLFFTVRGSDPEAVERAARHSLEVESVVHISEEDDGHLFECTFARSSVLASLLDRGAVLRAVEAGSDGPARVVLRTTRQVDVRELTRLLAEAYGEARLRARRERDDPVMTREEFESEFRTRLTERQEEVLQTAYYSGFFEWPRATTGQELAEMLGVSQPTVNRHIRTGERKLFDLLFEGG